MTKLQITLNKLEEEYNKNSKEINDIENKIRALNGADFEYKVTSSFAFGMIPWMALLFASVPLCHNGILSIDLLPLFTIVGPGLIGIAASKIMLKRAKIKERLSAFSTSTKQSEALEERTHLQLEKAILENINLMIKQTYDSVKSENTLVTSLKDKYRIEEKQNTNAEPNNLEYLSDLERIFEEKKEEIRIATTQKFLRDTFWKHRDNYSLPGDLIIFPMITYIAGMMMIGAPLIMNSAANTPLTPFQFKETFFMPAIASAATISYLIKKNKTNQKSFDNINESLGSYKIPAKINRDKNDEHEIDLSLEKAINEAAAIKIKIEEVKRRIESQEISESKTHTLESPLLGETHTLADKPKSLKKVYPGGDNK